MGGLGGLKWGWWLRDGGGLSGGWSGVVLAVG